MTPTFVLAGEFTTREKSTRVESSPPTLVESSTVRLPIFASAEVLDFSPTVWLVPFASSSASADSSTSAADAPPTITPPSAMAANALRATRDDPFVFPRASSSAAPQVPVDAFQTVRYDLFMSIASVREEVEGRSSST
nr:hypothetical protein [Burkholderia lata]